MHEKNWNIQNIWLLKSENWLCYKTLLLGKKHERSNKHTRFKQITTSTNLWGRTNQHGNGLLWAFYTDRLLALNLTLLAVVVQTPRTGRCYKYSLSGFPPFYMKGLTSCKMCLFTSISRFSCTTRRILDKSGTVRKEKGLPNLLKFILHAVFQATLLGRFLFSHNWKTSVITFSF